FRRHGIRIAIDDFGSGHSGLQLLASIRPDFVKLDMALCLGVAHDRARRVIVRGAAAMCRELGSTVIAEGVESVADLEALLDVGIRYFQGFLFAHPCADRLPDVAWPEFDGSQFQLM